MTMKKERKYWKNVHIQKRSLKKKKKKSFKLFDTMQ